MVVAFASTIALSATLAATLPASLEAATHKHAKGACPPGSKATPHRGCRTSLPATAGNQLNALEQLSWTAAKAGEPPPVKKRKANKVPKPLRNGLPSLVTGRAAKTALQRAFGVSLDQSGLTSPRIARISSATVTGSEAGPTVNGWQTQLSASQTTDNSRIGMQDTDATVTATKEATQDGAKIAGVIALEFRNRQLVDRCPAADGTVPGDGINRFELRLNVTAKDGHAHIAGAASGYVNFDWTYLGHVNDDGTITSFDLKMKATSLIEGGIHGDDGKIYSVEPPKALHDQY